MIQYGRRAGGHLGQCFEQHIGRPRTLADELLQGLIALAQARGHRFDTLALAIEQKPAHVHTCPVPPLRTSHRSGQTRQKALQTLLYSLKFTRLHPTSMHRPRADSNHYCTEYY